MKTGTIIKHLTKRQSAIAVERDKLDELLSELSGLRESCDSAWESLQDAIDALSELV